MRLLADENIHAALVRWLRDCGHDVRYVAEDFRSLADTMVLEEANRDRRILVTDDKDFGDLAIRHRLSTQGIVLIRLSSPDIRQRIAYLTRVWPIVEANAPMHLVVVSDDKVRIRPLPRV